MTKFSFRHMREPKVKKLAKQFMCATVAVLVIKPISLIAYEAPLYCSYVPSHEKIICDVNVEGLSVTDAILNDGKCISPIQRLKSIGPSPDAPGLSGTYRIPLVGDFRRTYEEGQSFYILIDPKCDLKTYTIKANDKIYRFDNKPVFPLYDPF